MQDMRAQLEKLLNDAEECALISKLATDKDKRELFAKLAEHLKVMAADVEGMLTQASAAQAPSPGATDGNFREFRFPGRSERCGDPESGGAPPKPRPPGQRGDCHLALNLLQHCTGADEAIEYDVPCAR